jgi:hypothetical protein
MLPVVEKPPISPRRKALALAFAGFIDLLQVVLFPAMGIGYLIDDALDVITAIVLIAICGFKWQFVVAFLFELIPVATLFPTWTAVVLLLPVAPDREGVRVAAGPPARQDDLVPSSAVEAPPVQPQVPPVTTKSP